MTRSRYFEPASVQENFQDMRADYSAAKPSRFKRQRSGLLPYGSNADWHLRVPTHYYSVMEQTRDMDRNDQLIGQMVDRAATNIVQDGLTLDPQTGDKGADRAVKARFEAWADDPEECDVEGECTFDEGAYLALRQSLVDGDLIALLLRAGSIQQVEGHRCRSVLPVEQDVVLGVRLSKSRKRIGYLLSEDVVPASQGYAAYGNTKEYAARDAKGERVVCQVYDRYRTTQTRGMSALTPVVDCAGMIDDLLFAQLVKAQVSACYAVFREKTEHWRQPDPAAQQGADTFQNFADGSNQLVEGIQPGMQIEGKPGEKLTGFSPAVPNAEFFPHIRLMIEILGLNLGLPLIVSLLDASETNFSAWRGAVDQARQGWRRKQRMLRDRYHSPVYRWKVRQWMADDCVLRALHESGKINALAHRWNMPGWPYIDPTKDAASDLLRLRNGLTSPRRLHHEHGAEHAEVMAETVDDNARTIVLAKKMAAKINAKFPDDDPVHWRELAPIPLPEGVEVKATVDAGVGLADEPDGDDPAGGQASGEGRKPGRKAPGNSAARGAKRKGAVNG